MLIPVASVIAFKENHGRVILYLSLSGSLSSCSVCLGLCSKAEGQMCVRKKSLQQRWQAPFKLNCLNLKFIICKLLSGLASCYMEREWKKCQVFVFWMKCSDVSLLLSCFCLGPVGLRKVRSFSEIRPKIFALSQCFCPLTVFFCFFFPSSTSQNSITPATELLLNNKIDVHTVHIMFSDRGLSLKMSTHNRLHLWC